jgi:hypothetical protein
MSKKLTPWFPGSAHPTRSGVYERMNPKSPKSYSYFEGGIWYGYTGRIDAEGSISYGKSDYQQWKWRGLAAKKP